MANSYPPLSARAVTPACPFLLVDLLRCLGLLRRFTEPASKEVEDMILWLSCRINELTGLPVVDILTTIVRLAEGQGLDGLPPGSLAEAYCGPRLELSHVAAPLHQLDKDGTTARLWRQSYKRWPIIREVHRELLGGRDA